MSFDLTGWQILLPVGTAIGAILFEIGRRIRSVNAHDPTHFEQVQVDLKPVIDRIKEHEDASQQRMNSLIETLSKTREQQVIDERFATIQKEIDRLRNGKR